MRTKKIDRVYLGLILALLALGLIILTSASSVASLERTGSPFYYLKHQFFYGVVLGLAALIFFAFLPYKKLKILAWPIFLLSLIMSLLVFIPGFGLEDGGARRWVQILGIVFQPSEFLKLGLIILLSALLSRYPSFLVVIFISGIAGVVLFFQSDLGTMVLFLLVSLALFWSSGASAKNISIFISLLLVAILIFVLVAPFRISRILSFLNPERDPLGSGYQIRQALIAIGSGGVWGLGLGNSVQKQEYLPAVINDSIFAVIGEELGIFGSFLILILFIILTWRGFYIAGKCPNVFARLLAVGVTAWIFFQSMINIMGIINLLPLTGIPLPFISYGSSSLVATLAGVGVLLSITRSIK